MQDGDRIVRIGEQTIKDIYGYMNALRDYKVGDTVEVVVVRKDAEITLKVVLKESPRRRGPE
jgi:S1-C subfamily serine protease